MTMRTQGWGTSGGHGRLWEVMTGMEFVLEHLEDWKVLYEDETANSATEERRMIQGGEPELATGVKSTPARPSTVDKSESDPHVSHDYRHDFNATRSRRYTAVAKQLFRLVHLLAYSLMRMPFLYILERTTYMTMLVL
ncbi:hypothetical protein BFJ67_g16557 [Fusarium oxysporum f. sp. cepae]|nr:hypothetical protein BFJ67_g16557 [Fusarium oxysporum f. sp. cepae]